MSTETFVCSVCNLDYSTCSQFEEHYWSLIHHKQLETKFGSGMTHICCLCNARCDCLSSYAKHLIGQAHRAASDGRKKQKQLLGRNGPSTGSYSANNGQPPPRHAEGFQGQPRPVGPVPQTARIVQNRMLQQARQGSQFGQSYIHNSFQRSLAQQRKGNTNQSYIHNVQCSSAKQRRGYSTHSGHRTWTPKSDFEHTQSVSHQPPLLPSNSWRGSGLIVPGQCSESSRTVKRGSTQEWAMSNGKRASNVQVCIRDRFADRSTTGPKSLSQNPGAQSSTSSVRSFSDNQTGVKTACRPGSNTEVVKTSRCATTCLSKGNKPGQSETRNAQDQVKAGTRQDKDGLPPRVPSPTVSKKQTGAQKKPELKDTRTNSAGSSLNFHNKSQVDKPPTKELSTKQSATEKVTDRSSSRMHLDDGKGSGSVSTKVSYLVACKLLTSSAAEASQDTHLTQGTSSSSTVTQHDCSSCPSATLQRSVAEPSARFTKTCLPEVTRLNLHKANSDPGGTTVDPQTFHTVEAAESPSGLDQEASVTRIQLPPSLQRELTKLLVKSQAPGPRPNLAAARSRLHAGEHHQPQVVGSPDRMVQQLLMKLLDSPKSRERQVQQIEELQHLVQVSKKGSERARFGTQQFQEVSLNALESLLRSGQLKPLGPENLIPISLLEQADLVSSKQAEHTVDSKDAVRALLNADTLDHLKTSQLGSQYTDSQESLNAVIAASDTPAHHPRSQPAAKHKGTAVSKALRVLPKVEGGFVSGTEPVPDSKDQANDTHHPSMPAISGVRVKTEPGTEAYPPASVTSLYRVREAQPLRGNSGRSSHGVGSSDNLLLKADALDHPTISGLRSENADSRNALIATSETSANHPPSQSAAKCNRTAFSDAGKMLPKIEGGLVSETQAEPVPNSEDQADDTRHPSMPAISVRVKTEPGTDADGGIVYPPLSIARPCRLPEVQPLGNNGGSNSYGDEVFLSDTIQSSQRQPSALPITGASEAFTLDSEAGWIFNPLSADQQLALPSATESNCERLPTNTTASLPPKRRKSSHKRTPPAALPEVLLELSLQEELLHKKLAAMESRMKMTKELIRRKHLAFKNLKEQKKKISAEVLAIRAKRLRLLMDGSDQSAVCSTLSSLPVQQLSGDDFSSRPPASTLTASSLDLGTEHVSQVPSVTEAESAFPNRLSAARSACMPTVSGPDQHCVHSRSLTGSSFSDRLATAKDDSTPTESKVSRRKPGPKETASRKAPPGIKRKLQQSISDITPVAKRTKSTKTPKGKKNPKATGKKASAAAPTRSKSSHGKPSATGNAPSLYSSVGASSSVPLSTSPFTIVQGTLTVIDGKVCLEGSSNSTHSEQAKSQDLMTGSWTDATTSRLAGERDTPSGMKTQDSTLSESYRIYEISSDSESSFTPATSCIKSRRVTRSHPTDTIVWMSAEAGETSSAHRRPLSRPFPPHCGSVLAIGIDKWGLFSAAADGTIRAFNIKNFTCKKILTQHKREVTCLALWNDHVMKDAYLCTGSNDQAIHLYKLQSLKLERTFTCEDRVTCLVATGRYLYATLSNDTIPVYDLRRMEKVMTLAGKTDCKIEAMTSVGVINPKNPANSKRLLIAYGDWTIGVHDAANGTLLQNLKGHTDSILCLKMYKQLLYSGSADRTVMIHDIQTGKRMGAVYGHGGSVTGIIFHNGSLVTSSLDGKIRLFTLTGTLHRLIASFPQSIQCMAQLQHTLYVGCKDGAVRAVSALAEPTQASLTPVIKKRKKKLKEKHFCQWKGCVKKVKLSSMRKHLRGLHMKPNTLCLWANCRVKFTGQLRSQKKKMAEHAEVHVKDFHKSSKKR